MPSSNKSQYNERQKRRIKQLEQLYDGVARQVEGLSQQNSRLRLRNDVLSALVQSSDIVDELYARSDAPTGPVGPDDRVRLIALALEYSDLVNQLRVLVAAAEADTSNPGKLEAVVGAVRTLAAYGIQAAAPNDCERHMLLATVQMELLFPALQVPEEQHWQQVVNQLHLTPDQQQKALLARELFQASMVSTLMPRPDAVPPQSSTAEAGPSTAPQPRPHPPAVGSTLAGSPTHRLAQAAMMGGSRVRILYDAYQEATAALPSTLAPPVAAALPPQPAAPQPSSPSIPQLQVHTVRHATPPPLPARASPYPVQLSAASPLNPPASSPRLRQPAAGLRTPTLPHLPTVIRPTSVFPTVAPHSDPTIQPPPFPLHPFHQTVAPAPLSISHIPPQPPALPAQTLPAITPAPQASAPALRQPSGRLPSQVNVAALSQPGGRLLLQPVMANPPVQPSAAASQLSHASTSRRPAAAPQLQAAAQHQRLSAAVGPHWPHAEHGTAPSTSPAPSRTPTPGLPTAADEAPTLGQLEQYLIKFWDWSHTLAVYFGTMLLEPLQAARSYINAYPTTLCPVAVLNTIHAMSEGQPSAFTTDG